MKNVLLDKGIILPSGEISKDKVNLVSRLDIIIPRLAASAGATEALKAQDPMKWVRLMNACKAQAEEVVKFELIYD